MEAPEQHIVPYDHASQLFDYPADSDVLAAVREAYARVRPGIPILGFDAEGYLVTDEPVVIRSMFGGIKSRLPNRRHLNIQLSTLPDGDQRLALHPRGPYGGLRLDDSVVSLAAELSRQ